MAGEDNTLMYILLGVGGYLLYQHWTATPPVTAIAVAPSVDPSAVNPGVSLLPTTQRVNLGHDVIRRVDGRRNAPSKYQPGQTIQVPINRTLVPLPPGMVYTPISADANTITYQITADLMPADIGTIHTQNIQ